MVSRFLLRRSTACRIASTSALAAAASLMGSRLLAQESGAQNDSGPSEALVGPPQPATLPHARLRLYDPEKVDISLGVFPQLTGTRVLTSSIAFNGGNSFTETTQGTTPSAGVLGTFHQQVSPWIGYNVNLGYTRLTENYFNAIVGQNSNGSAAGGSGTHTEIDTNLYELSLGLVAKGPVSTRRLQTFVQGGGALLTFLPTQKDFKGAVQFRPAVLFGAGVDYRLSNHLGVRLEYRGFFYKSPDFEYNYGPTLTKAFTVTSEPTISLIYRFGAHRHGLQ